MRRSLGSRLAWFAALWLAGVTVTAAVAYAIRWWLVHLLGFSLVYAAARRRWLRLLV